MKARATVTATTGATASVTPRPGAMLGVVRKDSRRFVDVDDVTLAELHKLGGRVLVIDSTGSVTAGALIHDGQTFVIKLDATLDESARRTVKIKPRLEVGAQQAAKS